MTTPTENTQAKPVENSKEQELERNFAQQRKYYERQMAEQKAAYEQHIQQMQQQAQPQYEGEEVGADEYVDKRSFLKELDKRLANVDKKIDQKAEEKARALVDQERQSAYLDQNPDFHNILSPDNLQKFADKHPAMAKAMLKMPDNFERQQLLYENIKALGVNKPPEAPKPIQETIDRNRRSPYYQPSSVGTAPYANNGDFSPQGQKNAYDKMKDLIKNRRSG